MKACPTCRATKLVASTGPYRYTESGLPNVTLLGVTVYRCKSCGEELVSIPRITELHRVLAAAVIAKHAKLTAEEVRYLRTHLDKSSEQFAALVGVSREQVSHGSMVQHSALPLTG